MKMRKKYRIASNVQLNTQNVYRMVVANVDNSITPGQFVNISVPGKMLPRPISVADYKGDQLSLIYRVVGEGTEILSRMNNGEELTILSSLGNGFDVNANTLKPLVVGGGLGAAPLFYLVKCLKKKGLKPTILLGFRNPEDAFYLGQYKKYFFDCDFRVSYDSEGQFVTNLMEELPDDAYDYFYACGPKPMLKAVESISKTDGELSLEARMACGIGICKCCSIETDDGMKTLCKDGPVLKKGTIRW